ncbi:hypothetical protein KY336_00270 [Candidatus Woesearchaeota archaeon]|nr:hypothetical protein [Candidatus Woesearchaeota archaeon]
MRKAVFALFALFVTITLFVSACANQVGEQKTEEQIEIEQKHVLELAEQEAIEEIKQIAEQRAQVEEQIPAVIEKREELPEIRELLDKIDNRIESYSYYDGKNKVLVNKENAKIELYTDLRYDKQFIDAVHIDRESGAAVAICEDIKNHLDCRKHPDTKLSIVPRVFIAKTADQWLRDALHYKLIEHNEFAETISTRPCSKLILEDEEGEQVIIWYDQYWGMPMKVQKGDKIYIYKGYSYNIIDEDKFNFDFGFLEE